MLKLGLLGSIACLAGTTFVWVAIGVATIPPLTFVAVRLGLAALLVFMILHVRRLALPRGWTLWRHLAVLGLLSAALPFALVSLGARRLGANAGGLAAIYNAALPLWTALAAPLLVPEERATRRQLGGILLGFVGVLFLLYRALAGGLSGSPLGHGLCLASAVCASLGPLYVRRFLRGLPGPVLAFGQLATGALWVLPAALLVDGPVWALPSGASLAALLGVALIGTGVVQTLYMIAVQRLGASATAQVSYVIPVFALGWAWLLRDEPLHPAMLLGLGTILLGVALAQRPAPAKTTIAPLSQQKGAR